MVGIEALAFINPDIKNVQGVFSEVSQTIERPVDDFDRSHKNSIPKGQVKLAMKKTDAIVDQVNDRISEGRALIEVLKQGNEEEVSKLELQDHYHLLLSSLVNELKTGNNRLAYTFFKAESDPAWHPHIRHLRYIKTRALESFGQYRKVTEELCKLVYLYQTPTEEGFSYDISTISKSIDSETVEHPEWVQNGDDFVEWIKSM